MCRSRSPWPVMRAVFRCPAAPARLQRRPRARPLRPEPTALPALPQCRPPPVRVNLVVYQAVPVRHLEPRDDDAAGRVDHALAREVLTRVVLWHHPPLVAEARVPFPHGRHVTQYLCEHDLHRLVTAPVVKVALVVRAVEVPAG